VLCRCVATLAADNTATLRRDAPALLVGSLAAARDGRITAVYVRRMPRFVLVPVRLPQHTWVLFCLYDFLDMLPFRSLHLLPLWFAAALLPFRPPFPAFTSARRCCTPFLWLLYACGCLPSAYQHLDASFVQRCCDIAAAWRQTLAACAIFSAALPRCDRHSRRIRATRCGTTRWRLLLTRWIWFWTYACALLPRFRRRVPHLPRCVVQFTITLAQRWLPFSTGSPPLPPRLHCLPAPPAALPPVADITPPPAANIPLGCAQHMPARLNAAHRAPPAAVLPCSAHWRNVSPFYLAFCVLADNIRCLDWTGSSRVSVGYSCMGRFIFAVPATVFWVWFTTITPVWYCWLWMFLVLRAVCLHNLPRAALSFVLLASILLLPTTCCLLRGGLHRLLPHYLYLLHCAGVAAPSPACAQRLLPSRTLYCPCAVPVLVWFHGSFSPAAAPLPLLHMRLPLL